jgi:AraC-like DNA-binding protein
MALDPLFGQFVVGHGEAPRGADPGLLCRVDDGIEHVALRRGSLPILARYVDWRSAPAPRILHGNLAFALVVDGRGTLRVDGRAVPAGKGDVFFLGEHVLHGREALRPHLSLVIVHVSKSELAGDPGYIGPEIADSVFFEPFFQWSHDSKVTVRDEDFGWVASQFFGLVHVCEGPSWARYELLRAELGALFRCLIALYEAASTPEKAKRFGYLREVGRYVKDHLRRRLHVEDLAKLFREKPVDFARTFTAETGMRPTAYVNRVRVSEAKRLLAGTALPITDILRDSGFQNWTNFNKVFRLVAGRSPSEYRALVCAGSLLQE